MSSADDVLAELKRIADRTADETKPLTRVPEATLRSAMDMARPRSANLLEELSASVYASLNASIRGEPQPVPATIEEWVRLRAGSAWVQTHGGHPLENVSAFLRDTDGFPEALGPPPPDLQARLLFAYAFLTATGGDPNKLEAPPTPERKNQ